jgi:RHS repeat-associated protein
VYDQAKAETAAVEHLPYGDRYAATGDAPYHEFTGKPWDDDAGLFYFPYRYYAPTIARWITPDPLNLVDGPNVYGYVRACPIESFDAFGLSECCAQNCGDALQCCIRKEMKRHNTILDDIQSEYLSCLLATGGLCVGLCVIGCGLASGPTFPACLLGCVRSCGVAGSFYCRRNKAKRLKSEQELHSTNMKSCELDYERCKANSCS